MNLTLIAGSIGDAIKNWFEGFFTAVLDLIPKVIYQLLTPLWAILDAMQWIMRKLAGLDTIASFEGSQDFSGDLVNYFIDAIFSGDSPVLSNVFWSMIILGALMLIITTFIAVIKSEYTATDAKSASKGKIIGSAFKAIASFAIVPIVCFFGIFLCNVILQAVDKITANPTPLNAEYSSKFKSDTTSGGIETYYNYSFFGVEVPSTNTPISGIIFRTAAYDANRVRSDDNFYNVLLGNEKVNAGGVFNIKNGTDDASKDYNANIIDEAFSNCYRLNTKQYIDREPFKNDHMFPLNKDGNGTFNENKLINEGYEYFDKNNVALVWYYYDLWSFHIIIAVGALVVVIMSFIHILLGLIKRIFELVLLFLISAPMASLMPLDGGNALKKWREKFVSKAIGVYGPVVGMNIFFIILGVLQSLKLTGVDIIDRVVYLLFVIAGLTMVKDFTGMLSELVGGEDTMKAGADRAKEVGAMAKNVGTKTAALVGAPVAAARAVGKGIKGAVNAGKKLKNFSDKRTELKEAKKAYKGKGIYSSTKNKGKGSQAYQNAIENAADNITDEDLINNELTNVDAEAVGRAEFDKMSDKQLKRFAKTHNLDVTSRDPETGKFRTAPNDELWAQLDKKEREEFGKPFVRGAAEKKVADMSADEKDSKRKELARAKLDSMDWRERKGLIDANDRTKSEQNTIRERAIKAAGGEEAYRSLSNTDRAQYLEQASYHRTAMGTERGVKNAQTKMELNPEKVEFSDSGKELGKAIAGAITAPFQEFAKTTGSFVQHMFDGLSGTLGEGMKGTGDSMLAAFQGKLKKEIGLHEEKKNQKKIMSAQRAAQAELDGKGPARQEREPRIPKKDKIELSEASIRAMERAVKNANESSAERTASAMNQVKSSIDTLTRALEDKSKKS